VKRLVVVAEESLIVEAIASGLRKSGEFTLLGHVDGRRASVRKIVDVSPDVVLIDEMEGSDQTVKLIAQIKAQRESIAVIVLTLSTDSALLDAIFDAGAAGAISKAANPAALATLIRETIDGRVLHLYKPVGSVPESDRKPAPVKGSLLSARELEVLQLVAAGSTNGDIARKLWVTEQTVKFHLSNIYRKLHVGNRTEASHYAHVNGLLSDGERVAAS
jgi:DNA-binding NarL/FixJ family response regulator